MKSINTSIIAAMIVLAGCSRSSGDSPTVAADSIYSIEHINHICPTQPERALALLDTAEQRGLMSQIDIDGMRAMVYQNTFKQSNIALIYARRAFAGAENKGDTTLMLKSLKMLTALSTKNSRYIEAMEYAAEGSRLSNLTHDDVSNAYFLQFVGAAKGDIGDIDGAIDYLERSAEIYKQALSQNPRWGTYDNLLYAYVTEANFLISVKRYDEALSPLERADAVLADMAKCNDVAEVVLDERTAEICALYTILYQGMGNKTRAREYFDKLNATSFGQSPHGYDLALGFLIADRQYDEALRRLEIEKRLWIESRDTISEYYINSLLTNEMTCYEGKGDITKALSRAKQIKILSDSLHMREDATRLAEQSTIFHINEIEMQLVESEQRYERIKLTVIIAILSIVFVLLAVCGFIYFKRIIRRKNKATAAIINELTIKKEQPKQAPEDAQLSLFNKLNDIIVADKLYLQPNFSRQQAGALINMQPRQLSSMFKQYANGFPDYINRLRLNHSVLLLKTKPNYTIEAIATECGFQSRQTFHRLFVERFGITPTDFRHTTE